MKNKLIHLDIESLKNENAFVILGQFKVAAKSVGWTEKEINEVVSEATSGDYEHLKETIFKYCK